MFLKLLSRQDRRRRTRQLLNTSVRVITRAGAMDAVGINISEDGMGLFTVAHLPIGSQVQVEFRTPDGPSSSMRLPGTVRHRALYLYGIEFETEQRNEPVDGEPRTKKGNPHLPYQA
jgi:PilZ domain